MVQDAQFLSNDFRPWEQPHCYGPNVHLIGDPLTLRRLAQLCAQGTTQPAVNDLLNGLYRGLIHSVAAAEFPRRAICTETRMIKATPMAVWEGMVTCRDTHVVVAALARGGIFPSQIVYDFLVRELAPEGVRQDHIAIQRTTNSKHQVTGATLSEAKIGGSIDGAILLIPDPMGATGSTVVEVRHEYRDRKLGEPDKIITLDLIVTPEYLRRLKRDCPEIIVYALRLDRGLSPPDVMETLPGARWKEERGLTDIGYIVPGAGGLGEVITNANA